VTRPMKVLIGLLLTLGSMVPVSHAQVIRSDVESAFVWGQDRSGKAVSSTTSDPLSGEKLETITYQGITVTFGIHLAVNCWRDFNYCCNESKITVVNHSGYPLLVKYNGSYETGTGKPIKTKKVSGGTKKVHEVKNDSAEALSVVVCPSMNVFRQSVQVNGTDYVFRVGET